MPRTFQDQYVPLSGQYLDATRRDIGRGMDVEADFLRRLRSYDPRAALREYATGAYGEIFDAPGGVREQVRDLRGASVGAGRIDTGFLDEDTGSIVQGGLASLSRALAQRSLETSQMDLNRIGMLGEYGTGVTERGYDLLSGGLDRSTAEINDNQRRRAQRWRALGNVAGMGLSLALPGVPNVARLASDSAR